MKKKKRRTVIRNKRIWLVLLGSMAILCILLCCLVFRLSNREADSADREKAIIAERWEEDTDIVDEAEKEDLRQKTLQRDILCEDRGSKENVSTVDTGSSKKENGNVSIVDDESSSKEAEKTIKEKKTENNVRQAEIQKKIRSMSLAEKVAQMFIITPEFLTGYSNVTRAGEATKEALNKYPVGGLIYMGANIKSEAQVTQMIQKQQQYSQDRIGLPLFVSVDEEGGQVTRIASCDAITVPIFPDLFEIGTSLDGCSAYELGDAIGEYLSRMGFNLDFAPVADVLTNPNNTVVKRRSYGSDPKIVAEMVKENLDGLWKHQVYGCIKHFPGHGATAGDTHHGYAYTNKTWKELKNSDVIPFQESIQDGVSFIMVGHISLPNVTKEDAPASLSSEVINELLREKLGYDGIVITDALNMGAVTQHYTTAQAAVQAVLAGNDILLMPADFKTAYEGIMNAVTDGVITEERLDESVGRILKVKFGL